MKLITKLIEPKRLLVIWQAPDSVFKQHIGRRFIVGEIFHDGVTIKLQYYQNSDTEVAFKVGFTGLTAYPYDHTVSSQSFDNNIINVLSRRLPPSSRTDYKDYLGSYRIAPDAEGISPLSLLAYTGGRIAGDGFSFFPTFEGVAPPFDFTFEIAGFRHNAEMSRENINALQDKPVLFKDDNANPHDKEAVAIECEGKKIGHVPKGANSVLKMLRSKYKVHAFITKINGTLERPNILIYISIL